jgi:hypothetical protein
MHDLRGLLLCWVSLLFVYDGWHYTRVHCWCLLSAWTPIKSTPHFVIAVCNAINANPGVVLLGCQNTPAGEVCTAQCTLGFTAKAFTCPKNGGQIDVSSLSCSEPGKKAFVYLERKKIDLVGDRIFDQLDWL